MRRCAMVKRRAGISIEATIGRGCETGSKASVYWTRLAISARWGIHAALAGAEQVTTNRDRRSSMRDIAPNLTVSITALRRGKATFSGCCKSCTRARSASIILDPPAFIKRRRGIKQGMLAHRRLNEFPMRGLGRDALLISCSCSYHPSLHQLVAQIHQAARHLDRDLQILSLGGQGPDHPLHPATP
jgi:23S rRNA (cytosine1962-C5)-methyltransferase